LGQKHPNLIHLNYRPDIDGLRALAILSVVLFHAFPDLIPGGFVGVDVFFVISGYLISSIIFGSLERNRFSITEFYIRRVKRIFPALLLVMITTLIIGWFVLLNHEFKQLGKHVFGGASFVSNFFFWQESGYFDTASKTKPLLHLWSLAIEEQFYIFWPILLLLVRKYKWGFFWVTASIAILSFAENIYYTIVSPESAFYLPIPRLWELMVGGILAYINQHSPELISKYKQVQSIGGLVLIALALILIDEGKAFPGWWALLPVVGTFLTISAGPTSYINANLLSLKPMLWIGLISYPLYLWHWVILSYIDILFYSPSNEMLFSALVLSFLLAWGTYRFVELPMRFGGKDLFTVKILLVVMMLLLVFGAMFYYFGKPETQRDKYLNYFENRAPEMPYWERTGWEMKNRMECNFFDMEKYRTGEKTNIPRVEINQSCYLRDDSYPHAVFIWGDSHARALHYGIKKNMPSDWQVLMVVSSGAMPNPYVTQPSKTNYKDHSNWFALKAIADAKPDVVIVAQNLGHHIETMDDIKMKLKVMGIKKIVFIGPAPHWKPDLPKIIAGELWDDTPTRTFVGVDKKVMASDKALKKHFSFMEGVAYASLIDFFCSDEGCMTYVGDDRKTGVTTYDYGHLTPVASDKLGRDLLSKYILNTHNVLPAH